MRKEEFKKYRDQDGYFVLTLHWTPRHQSVEILSQSSDQPGTCKSSTAEVESPVHPMSEDVEFTEEDRLPWGEPISYSYCGPLNEKELRRAHTKKKKLTGVLRHDDRVSGIGAFGAQISFYSAVIERFLFWFHTHEEVSVPELDGIDSSVTDLSAEDREFVLDTEERRRGILRDLFPKQRPVGVHVGAYDLRGGLRTLAEKVCEAEEDMVKTKNTDKFVDFISPESMRSYLARKTREKAGRQLTRPERLRAIFYWAHGMTRELEKLGKKP